MQTVSAEKLNQQQHPSGDYLGAPMVATVMAGVVSSDDVAGRMRARLEPEIDELMDEIIRRAKKGSRSCINGVVRIATAAGSAEKLLLAFLAAQGVTSLAEGVRCLQLAKRADGSTDTDAYRLAKQLVRARVMADPDERRRAMQEIFGAMEAPPMLTNGNGHAA